MLEAKKVIEYLKANQCSWFSSLELSRLAGIKGGLKYVMPYLVEIGAVKKIAKAGSANQYQYLADVDLIGSCTTCGNTFEVRLLQDGKCHICRRRKNRGLPIVGSKRDVAMRKLMTMPFGLNATHYANIFKDEHYDTR